MIGIPPAARLEHPRLVHVLDRVIAAIHIAINRAIPHRDLRLVACRQQHLAKLVRQRHQHHPAQPALDVLLRHARFRPRKQLRQRLAHRALRAGDRHRIQPAAQSPRHLPRILQRHGRGELGWQHHAAHIFRPQSIHRNRRTNRRIDPAGQAQQRLGEPGFAHVIAQSHHTGAVVRLPHHRNFGDLAGVRPPPLSPAPKRHQHHRLVKLRQLRHQSPAGVQHHRRPVEHLIILPADHVEVDQRQPRLHHPRHHQVQPQVRLAPVIRRAIRHQQDLRPRLGQCLCHIRVPGILADRRPDPHAAHHIRPMHIGRGKHPPLIKHRIVRQVVLQHPRTHPAALEHVIAVVQPPTVPHRPANPQRRAIGTVHRQRLQRRNRRRHEGRLQDQVLRLIPGDEHLGQRHHVGPRRAPLGPRLARQCSVPCNRPQHRVQLPQHQAEYVGHLTLPSHRPTCIRLAAKRKRPPCHACQRRVRRIGF